jgi:hypothetical protein
MKTILWIHLGNDAALAAEATQAIKDAGIEICHPRPERVGVPLEIIVALGSAGAFSGLYQIIGKLLEKNKGWEVTIESERGKITIKGPTLPEVKELLEQLAPELTKRKTSN